MKLILAQGNPGDKYTSTRHNTGFLLIDQLADKLGAKFTERSKFSSLIAETSISGEKVLLVKPTTYYNETGRSARQLVDFYKLDAKDDVLVIHDDIALPFGSVRVRLKGSSAGNNGIKSLNAHLGEDYSRIRVGVSNELRTRLKDDVSFVLAPFTKPEIIKLNETIFPQVSELIEDFCRGSLTSVSHNLL